MSELLKAKRLLWGILLMLVTAVAALSYSSGKRYLAAVQAVEQALAVRSAIEGTLSLFKDAETGQRGYLLSSDELFLEPYRAALDALPHQLDALRKLTNADPLQVEHMRKLDQLAQKKLQFMAESIRLRRAGDDDGSMARARIGEGKRVMDAMRGVTKQMDARELGMLQERRQEAETSKLLASWGVGGGILAMVLLALASWLTVNRDMQTLRQAAEELATSEAHFRLLTENTSDLVRLLDLNGRATYVSPSVERLLGYSADEFLALPATSLMHPDEVPLTMQLLTNVKTKALASDISTYRLRNKSGMYRFFEVRWSAQRNSEGKIESIHTVGRDVTERQLADAMLNAQAEDLRNLSLRDELTGLHNRRGFAELASQSLAQSTQDGRPAALIFVDLNGMKRINDELGHDAGDDALKDAANVLRDAFGDVDVVARLGGDEFVAFSVGFTETGLDALRRHVRELADAETQKNERPFRLSMSVGGAFTNPERPESLAKLLERADAAMYQQKRARQAAGNVSLAPPPTTAQRI